MSELPLTADLRPLGKSGIYVFPVAYGCWRLAGTDAATAREKIDVALDSGITLFDTADIYGLDDGHGVGAAEALFGEVLSLDPSKRDAMVIATKCGIVPGIPYDSTDAHVRASCEGSLTRMGIDVIDLFQIHRPDMTTHPEDVAATLTALRDEGKIRAIGVSNHTAAQFSALQAHLDFPIATHQPELSAWTVDPLRDGILDQCMEKGVTPLAWSPLAGGKLGLSPGVARQTVDERLGDLVEVLDELADREGVSRSAVAIAFLLAHPAGIVPIIGTQQPDRIPAALDAFKVKLTRSDWYDILEASDGVPLP